MILSWSAAASAACRRRGSTGAPSPRPASLSWKTLTISAATPSATNSRSGANRLIGYGGSQSLQSPNHLYSPVAKGLLRDLGVDIGRFETAFERTLYPSLGLSHGIFFNREAFGRDVLVPGEPSNTDGDETSRGLTASKPLSDFIAAFPISNASRQQIIALYAGATDPLDGQSVEQKRSALKRISYRDYLIKMCGCSEEAANCFQGRTLGFFGLGIDAVPAADARDLGYPGFAGLKLPGDSNAAWDEPYIYHFPDGNASIARLLVRSLIPEVAQGAGMDDVVLARFDYGALDRDGRSVRIRLEFNLRQRSRRSRRESSSPMCAAARCTVSRRAMRCWPAST